MPQKNKIFGRVVEEATPTQKVIHGLVLLAPVAIFLGLSFKEYYENRKIQARHPGITNPSNFNPVWRKLEQRHPQQVQQAIDEFVALTKRQPHPLMTNDFSRDGIADWIFIYEEAAALVKMAAATGAPGEPKPLQPSQAYRAFQQRHHRIPITRIHLLRLANVTDRTFLLGQKLLRRFKILDSR